MTTREDQLESDIHQALAAARIRLGGVALANLITRLTHAAHRYEATAGSRATKVHLDRGGTSACGNNGPASGERDAVTCGKCKQTSAWRQQ